MKKAICLVSFIIIFLQVSSQTGEKYLGDTTVYYATGLVPATAAELRNVPVLNTGILPVPKGNKKVASLDPAYYLNSITPGMPPPGDQGHIGSCSAWAVAYGMMSYLYGTKAGYSDYGLPEPDGNKIFSPSFIYNQRNNGVDHGISLITALQFIKHIGCCKWADMPPDKSYTEQPSNTASINASHYRITNYYRIRTNIIDSIKTVINKYKLPVVFAINIDEGFKYISQKAWETRQGNRMVWISFNGTPRHQHSMIIIGYDDKINAFKVQNSWKLNRPPYIYPWKLWGPNNDGYCWIDYSQFKKAVVKEPGTNDPEIFVGYLESPTISSIQPASITSTTAVSGGNITSDGGNVITERGISYSTNSNPTIDDSRVISGAGTGSFTSTLRGLTANTTYYLRAYAINSAGTMYGNEISFTTKGTNAIQKSKDPKCNVNNTGDFYFQNNTKLDLRVALFSTQGRRPSFNCTLQPGQKQCFYSVPAGPATYQIQTPSVITINGYGSGPTVKPKSYFANGSLYVDQCKGNTFFINEETPSYSTNIPDQTDKNKIQVSKDQSCNVNNTGDFYFQNNTKFDLKVALFSTQGRRPSFNCTLQPGQKQCFYSVPAGPATYQIQTPSVITINGYGSGPTVKPKSYFANGSLYVDQCKGNTFFINEETPSYSTNIPDQTDKNEIQVSKDQSCNVNNTGDFYFQNNTKLDLKVALFSTQGRRPSFNCTLQPGQKQCFYNVPVGPATYQIQTPSVITINGYGSGPTVKPKSYFANGSLYVDQCKGNTFFINEETPSYSTNIPDQTDKNKIQVSKDQSCNVNNTGDFYFQNNTKFDLKVALFSTQGRRPSFNCTLQPGQKQCFYNVPVGTATYQIQSKSVIILGNGNDPVYGSAINPKSYFAEGSLYVDVCQGKLFIIK